MNSIQSEMQLPDAGELAADLNRNPHGGGDIYLSIALQPQK